MPFRIETERLVIRPWDSVDRTAFAQLVADSEMMRYIGRGQPWDADRVTGYFQRQAGFLAVHACCVGAVCLKPAGAVVGMGGIQPLEKLHTYELAWAIWKDFWGQGFATEMALRFCDYAFNVMKLAEVVAIIEAANLASIRVAEKLGMQCLGLRDPHELAERYAPGEVLLYRLGAPQR